MIVVVSSITGNTTRYTEKNWKGFPCAGCFIFDKNHNYPRPVEEKNW